MKTLSRAARISIAIVLCQSAAAATITVTNPADSGPGSLRQALTIANAGDTIDATGISGVITLTSGELLVNKNLTIIGPGADLLAIDGNAASHVFRIAQDETVTISGFTIRNGHAGTAGGGIDNENNATVLVANCTISGNTAGLGSGIFNGGILTIASTTLSGNLAASGGGVYNAGAGTVTLTNSTVSGNMASSGGGMFNIGVLRIANSTLSGNSADPGGGVFNIGTLEIESAVLNTGTSGGNISNNSGTVLSHGYNLCSDDCSGFLAATGDQINTDPMLGPLQNNGGPTFTHALLTGSVAINAGHPNFTPPPITDQRGYARVFGGRIDIGSFEVQPTPPPGPIMISGTVTYCSSSFPDPVQNVVLTLTGNASGTILSDGSGNYLFTVPSGGSYDVTPNKSALAPDALGINTLDVVAVQRHFLRIGTPLSGCRLTAADVNSDTIINTLDVIAIQRFYLALSTGTANVGNYQFNPTNRSYRGVFINQAAQNFDTLILGDVATPFVE